MGSVLGVEKVAAKRVGVDIGEYRRLVATGQKWCTGCKAWHPQADFPVDRSRGDGRRAKCLKAEHGKPRGHRNPLHEAARRAVSYAIRKGDISHPDLLPCSDCQHAGGDRRHEYDHHRGYGEQNWLDVEPVCTLCHADREKARRNGGQ